VGATREQGRIKIARLALAELIEEGNWVVAVFSAYRRGRSGAQDKVSVTDVLQNYGKIVSGAPTLMEGVARFQQSLMDVHLELARDLKLDTNQPFMDEIRRDIEHLGSTVETSCTAHERIPSLNDYIVTAGERLAVKILAGYFNRMHEAGKFPVPAVPLSAWELGIYTDDNFGQAAIDWPRAVEHAQEVLVGRYLEQGVMPIVTGFDGIYDPASEFKQILQSPDREADERRYSNVYRTSLGRGGSDLTATFLGLALSARYVGFCKETPGVLTADDMLVGDAAETLTTLSYDLATEAGNIYSRAVEPVRAGNVPVHIFDPARPEPRTVISHIQLDDGFYIVERPIETVNIHVGTIPDEPGELGRFLGVFTKAGINVEEVRHQRAGTDAIVIGDDDAVQTVVEALDELGLRPTASYTWYLRVIGNVTPSLCASFNQFMMAYHPYTLASYQADAKVVTATIARNRAGLQLSEANRVEEIVRQLHQELVINPLHESQKEESA
jgi:aspartokinase